MNQASRWRRPRAALVLTALAAVVAAGMYANPAEAAAGNAHPAPSPANPYSPAAGHGYRHGVVPTRDQHAKMQAWATQNTSTTAATGSNTLSYGGGVDGIGVTSGAPKVYLVFWGSQWGGQGTDAAGNLTFSGDAKQGAPYLQKMYKGLGTGGEAWSGVLTQYCDGPSVGYLATSCPTSAAHIPYPSGGVFAGAWYDNAAAEPAAANGHQLAVEAINAAAHFGNTTPASNRYAQYIILSPSGTSPDGFLTSNFCAWHDYNGDSGLTGGAASSGYGDIAFTNMPYVMDRGTTCGQNFVNPSGTLDGYSMVAGHEYAETLTDQNPAGGWTNHVSGSSMYGEENADECAWISSGQGASSNISTGTGTFAMQSSWSNDTNRCDLTHPVSTLTMTNAGSRIATVGKATSLQLFATGATTGQSLTYTATGLPAGLTLNAATGMVSGTPTTAATYSVTATASDRIDTPASITFSWAVTGAESTLSAGHSLTGGQILWSPSHQYYASFQTDGNLVVYGPTGAATWNSGTYGQGGTELRMQTDGNLVIYTPSVSAVWSTATWNSGSSNRLVMQDDGRLVLYTGGDLPVWINGTRTGNTQDTLVSGQTILANQYLLSASGQYEAVLQADGNFAVWGPTPGTIHWYSGTSGQGVDSMSMQTDGNLVLYAGTRAVWYTGTTGSGNRLVMQDDGNLIVYSSSNVALWANGHLGAP